MSDKLRNEFFTWAELEAASLCAAGYRGGCMSTHGLNPHEDADRIIALAERIKAERATAAMVR